MHCFFYYCEFWFFLKAMIFFILIMFLREQSWRNSLAKKRGGNWYGMRYEMRVTRCEYFYHKVHWDGVKWLRFWAHWGTSEMFWMRDEGWGVKSWSWWIVKGCEMQDGVYAYRKEPFPFWRDSSLCCASFRMTRFCFYLRLRIWIIFETQRF